MSTGSDTPSLDELTAALGERRAHSLAMGGSERVDRQHEKHKLTARERIPSSSSDCSRISIR
jgi:acetyl-CoA carboxylase carboxyltransferase component